MNAVDPSNYTSSFGSVASRSAGRATVLTIWVAVALLLQGLGSTRDHVRAVNEMSQPMRHDGATLAAKRLPGARRYFPLCLELLVVAPFDAAAMLMRWVAHSLCPPPRESRRPAGVDDRPLRREHQCSHP